jgi:hypothetical protein
MHGGPGVDCFNWETMRLFEDGVRVLDGRFA